MVSFLSTFTYFLICSSIWMEVVDGSEDKFIKKYALMKLYESCFGSDVVKEIRKEIKMASVKCGDAIHPTLYSNLVNSNKLKIIAPTPSSINSILQMNRQAPDLTSSAEHLKNQFNSKVDLNKLQQAIIAGYNQQISEHSQYQNSPSNSMLGYSQHPRPWNNFPSSNGVVPYFSQQGSINGFLPSSMQPPPPLNPFYQSYFSPFYYGGRTSKDLNSRSSQSELLSSKLSGKVRNVTCVMQELGYLNENLEPDYDRMIRRVKYLRIPEELKSDITQGIEYCKKFSLCIPEQGNEKPTKEMAKSMFFFRCYKHKKMEACVMKDIKERYSLGESENDLLGIDRSIRSNNIHGNENDHASVQNEFNDFTLHNDDTNPDVLL